MPIYTGTIRGTVTDSLGQQVFADLPVNITIEDLAGCASLTSWSIVQTIDAVDTDAYWFGFNLDVSVDNSVIFIGAPYDESVDSGPPTVNSGAVHSYEFDGVEYVSRTIFSATNPSHFNNNPDYFGGGLAPYAVVTRAIASNDDGTVVVVGAPNYYETSNVEAATGGAVYVFVWNGTSYVETAQLFTRDTQTDTSGGGEWFGSSVALKGDGGDGSYIFVGSPEEYNNVSQQVGYVHVFKNNSGVWSSIDRFRQASSGTNIGYNMKLSRDGNTLVVTDSGGWEEANAIVFKWNNGLEQMEEYATIVGPAVANVGDVAISADGSRIVYANGNAPYVGVFDDNGDNTFTEHELTLDGGNWIYGLTIAMCDSGDVVYVADPFYENDIFEVTGALVIYKYNEATWVQVGLIEGPDDYDSGWFPFGSSVSCSSDGTIVLVGAPEGTGQVGDGRVYVIRGTS